MGTKTRRVAYVGKVCLPPGRSSDEVAEDPSLSGPEAGEGPFEELGVHAPCSSRMRARPRCHASAVSQAPLGGGIAEVMPGGVDEMNRRIATAHEPKVR